MAELLTPINPDPHFRVHQTSSDSRLRQSDAHSDKQRQGKRRHRNDDRNDDGSLLEDEKVHSLDLLA